MDKPVSDNLKVNVPFDDLRGWIEEADKLGELRHADGYDWEEQIGMAAELLQHDENAPVALFDKIPGAPEGWRVLTNFFAAKRKNMTLGFPTDLNKIELSEAFLGRFRETAKNPMPYEIVESGPVFENIMRGDDVDVTSSPRRYGMTATMAIAISAPAASTSPSTRTRIGSMSAPTG